MSQAHENPEKQNLIYLLVPIREQLTHKYSFNLNYQWSLKIYITFICGARNGVRGEDVGATVHRYHSACEEIRKLVGVSFFLPSDGS